jgi:hypothetical protein
MLGKSNNDRIAIKPSHRGLLHQDLGIPQGQPIPEAALEQAEHSSDPAERKRAVFAENARTKFNHPGQSAAAKIKRATSSAVTGLFRSMRPKAY